MKKLFILLILLFPCSIYASEFSHIVKTNPETTLDLVDDFMGGSTETGEVGKLGWTIAGTNAAISNSGSVPTNNPGIKTLATEAVINSPAQLVLGTSVNATQIVPDIFDITYILSLSSVADITVRVGLANDWTNLTAATRGVWFVFTTTVTGQENAGMSVTKWVTVTKNGGSVSYNNTTIANVGTGIYKLRMVRVGASAIDFYINGVFMFQHTTNLPSAAVLAGIFVESQAASTSKSVNIDYARIKKSGLSR